MIVKRKGERDMKEVRIGLVDTGQMGKSHTNDFANALILFGPESGKPVFEVVADVNLEVAKVACEKFGFSR